MDAGLLSRLFGHNQEWQDGCTVVLDAEAAIQTVGIDSIQGGGVKVYAPRLAGVCQRDAQGGLLAGPVGCAIRPEVL